MMDKKAIITGGLGFIGCNLALRLLKSGWTVVLVDDLSNFATANTNLLAFNDYKAHQDSGKLKFVFQCVTQPAYDDPTFSGATHIFHFASLASPPLYMKRKYHTMAANSLGLLNYLWLAKQTGARLVFTSTSEVYGDPLEHPQKETYNGNCSLIGPRACYDESKRFGEVLLQVLIEEHGINAGIVRLFNSYGPHMHPADGRVVPNLLLQAMNNEPITVYGDGSQTRSFCYVDDTVSGILKMAESNYPGPVNLGTEHELSILELANTIKSRYKSRSEFIYKELPKDDPTVRKPDLTVAREVLKWEPEISLEQGLDLTYDWMVPLQDYFTNGYSVTENVHKNR